jgi:type II secretory pathway pseudopilin PulG
MFSLIITIISIALVAVLALATLYYGGSAFNKGSTSARTSQLLTEAQQVEGAITLFKAEAGRGPVGLTELTTDGKYLRSLPAQWSGGPAYFATAGSGSGVSEDSCLMFNQRRLGISVVPSCDDPAYTSKVVCCQEAPAFATP